MVASGIMLYESVWSLGEVQNLERIMAQDHSQVDQVWQQAAPGIGRERMQRGILAYRKMYPDLTFTVQDVAASGEHKVFVHWTASGTNLGAVADRPPSGRKVEFAGISLLTFNDAGQIQESRVYRQAPEDEASYFLQQSRGAAQADQS